MFGIIKKKRNNRSLASAVAAVLLICTLAITVYAVDLSKSVAVDGLTVNDTGSTAWSASSGGAVWEGTAAKGSGCNAADTAVSGSLVLTNNSGETKVLSFDYALDLQNGSFKIGEDPKTSNGSHSVTLTNGESITLTTSSSDDTSKTTTVTLSNIKLGVQTVTITFAAPQNGSYTVDGDPITTNTDVTDFSTTTYALVATPAADYSFVGWYLGETKVYDSATVSAASFATTGTVIAKFVPTYTLDPLYIQATVPSGSEYTKDDLVSIDSRYYHNTNTKLNSYTTRTEIQNMVADSAYSVSPTPADTKDKVGVQYIPSQRWSDSVDFTFSKTAQSEHVTGLEETYALARVQSDIIRIYAKKSCTLSFDYTGAMSVTSSAGTKTNESTIYYKVIRAADADVATVKTGTQLTASSGSSGTITLTKGDYLYIMAEGYAEHKWPMTMSTTTMLFTYSASILNLQVSYNPNVRTLNAGFQDNTGAALGSGEIVINDVGYSIGANGQIAEEMELALNAPVNLRVKRAPENYAHIGWAITDTESGEIAYHYTNEYSYNLGSNSSVAALFAPKMTISMGPEGYSNAAYTLPDGTAANGQYVARRADSSLFYTTLADAFADTNENAKTIVLLAGHTIAGDWTIPSGKTLVIPYDLEDVASTTPVPSAQGGNLGDYCAVTLTGNLTVEGTLLVNAKQYAKAGGYDRAGAPDGNVGHLVLASGATITVNGNASLYAYGPITGSGTITANDNASIHEFVDVPSNRRAGPVSNMYTARTSYHVFPFNCLYINNIEVPVTYYSGATLTGHVALELVEGSQTVTTIPVIGAEKSLFNCTFGSVTKYYDHATGQFVVRVNEKSTVSTGSFSMETTLEGRKATLDTADYYMPFAAAYRFEVAGNLTFNGNYKFLPGAKLDVKVGGKVTVPNGSNLVFYRMNDYDYRGRNSAETAWGYGQNAYPSNPIRFPNTAYAFNFSQSNVGSAKLNVDGELIVEGGLYVTEDLKTEGNGIAYKSNGYNNLTGYGTINMTDAISNLEEIYEGMTTSTTNDITWDSVEVVQMKGLTDAATADEAEQYESLSGSVRGYDNSSNLNVWGAAYTATINWVDGSGDVLKSFSKNFACGADVSAYYKDAACKDKATIIESDGLDLYVRVAARVEDADGEKTYYLSLPEAITTAGASDVVILMSDVTLTSTINVAKGQTRTIKLYDGENKYKVNSSIAMFNNAGTLNLYVGGTISFKSEATEVIRPFYNNGGTMKLDLYGGSITVDAPNVNNARHGAIYNLNGDMTITDTSGSKGIISSGIQRGLEPCDHYQANIAAVIRNQGASAKLRVSNVKLKTINAKGNASGIVSVLDLKPPTVPSTQPTIEFLQNVDIEAPTGFCLYNHGGIVELIDGGTWTGYYGIKNRNAVSSQTGTEAAPMTVSEKQKGTIKTIQNVSVKASNQLALRNLGTIEIITGTASFSAPKNAVYNDNQWYYNSAERYTGSGTDKLPTIDSIGGDVSITSTADVALVNFGNIGSIGDENGTVTITAKSGNALVNNFTSGITGASEIGKIQNTVVMASATAITNQSSDTYIASIGNLGAGLIAISTGGTSHYAVNNVGAGSIKLISDGYYYHPSGRNNAIHSPEDQIYPPERGLSDDTQTVSGYPCYYITDTQIEHTHTYTETLTAPTCTEQGYTTYTCSCGHTYTGNYVDAHGHFWGEDNICEYDNSHVRVAMVEGQSFTDLSSAVDAVNNADTGAGTVVMMGDSSDAITITGEVTLDLNGCSYTGIITVSDDGVFYGIDSTSNGLTNTYDNDGHITYGTISAESLNNVTVAPYNITEDGKLYVTYYDADNQAYSFHRVRFGVDSYTYYCSASTNEVQDVLDFSITFKANTTGIGQLSGYGAQILVADSEGNELFNNESNGSVWDGTPTEVKDDQNNVIAYILKGRLIDIADAKIVVTPVLKIGKEEDVNEIVNVSESVDMSVLRGKTNE